MSIANAIFDSSLVWLRQNYSRFTFYCERDFVWTLQIRLAEELAKEKLDLRVFNDYPIFRDKRQRLSADLVVINDECQIELAAEFKYEPSHDRVDIPSNKFPVVMWGHDGVSEDIDRIYRFVHEEGVKIAHAFFIDEGGAFQTRAPHPNSEWLKWDNGTWVLHSVATQNSPTFGSPHTQSRS